MKTLFSIISALAMITAYSHASADQIINDNLIVQGKFCNGTDCINDQVFSDETVRLRENNVRLTFIDSSADPAAQSWRLVANDTADMGRDNFQLQVKPDLTATETGTVIAYFGAAGNGSIALGHSSEIVDGAVSTGALTLERRIINVARALADTDLATLADLTSSFDNLNGRLDAVEAQFSAIQSTTLVLDSIDSQLNEIERAIQVAEKSKLVRSGGSISPFILLFLLVCFVFLRLRREQSGSNEGQQ
jgi:hypothetical protein